MRRGRLAALLSSLLLALAAPATAQEFATLLADRVSIDPDGAVTAEGNVEVFYEEFRLTAPRLRYEEAGERLFIEGPITLADGDNVSLLADAAELDADFRNGILLGAQMVLDQELQIAAARIDRVDGRYVQLSNAVATSCRVCAANPTPIWEIRAARVIHDTELRRVFFEDAQFRLAGVPVAYLPRFSMPDPTVERARGFLPPRIVNSSLLSFGLQTPYFVPMGDHADILLTPWVSDVTTTLVGRYRQRLRFGQINVNGAVSDDRLTEGLRAFVFADWQFLLPGEFILGGDLELVSDPAYLSNYDFSDKDRLDSAISVRRTTAQDDLCSSSPASAPCAAASCLQGSGDGATARGPIRARAADGRAWRRSLGALRHDRARAAVEQGRRRTGRHPSRGRGAVAGRRRDGRRSPGGGRAGPRRRPLPRGRRLELRRRHPAHVSRRALDLRWPLQKSEGRVSHLLEPALMVAWSRTSGGEVPDEDSTLIDFDEGNLFALSRFPGYDRTEEGLRGSLAVAYTRRDPEGWSLGGTVGRAYWTEDPGLDSISAGLTGLASDWLVSVRPTIVRASASTRAHSSRISTPSPVPRRGLPGQPNASRLPRRTPTPAPTRPTSASRQSRNGRSMRAIA
jgi:LPS-assembly protein